jgi:hypothetical protein
MRYLNLNSFVADIFTTFFYIRNCIEFTEHFYRFDSMLQVHNKRFRREGSKNAIN